MDKDGDGNISIKEAVEAMRGAWQQERVHNANDSFVYHVPDGLGVRIPGFHPGGPGSIPGLGVLFEFVIRCD